MRAFHYWSGEEVKVGDYVREVGRAGRVIEIIQPGSETAMCCDCAEGGVRTSMDMSGTKGNVLWEPPDGACWEDLEFLGRHS
jgi:hypothetical protein